VLFTDDGTEPASPDADEVACGFYWTEGVRGLGWAADAVPTLKGGSTIGIPSPPAIWMPDGEVVIPDLRDAERLQGFDADWTAPAVDEPGRRNGPRWKLVGNAVSVPVSRWLGERLVRASTYDATDDVPLEPGDRWPRAAWGCDGETRAAAVSAWPRHDRRTPLAEFLEFPTTPLSARATAGFLRRARQGRLRFPDGFLDDLERHRTRMASALVPG
jgi:DNA (cytosine-5)-methyltransferase 1